MTENKTLTWDDVLRRNDIIGGDIEVIRGGIVHRAPIAKVEIIDEVVQFTSPWCATLVDGEWQNSNATYYTFEKNINLWDIGENRIYFSTPCLTPPLASCTIFLRGGWKLDPHKVNGLAPASERLLALYPSLPFDRTAAMNVLCEKNWPQQLQILVTQLPEGATLKDLLNQFRADNAKEEFLWCYIEAVTGERFVEEKVY